MIGSAHDSIEAPHRSDPHRAPRLTAGTTHQQGRLVAMGILLVLIAVGIIVSL